MQTASPATATSLLVRVLPLDDADPALSNTEVLLGLPEAARPLLRGRKIFLYEAAPGGDLPRQAERRCLRRGVEQSHGREALVIFTDTARSAYVWTWRGSPAQHGRYLEHRTPSGEAALLRDLAPEPSAPRGDAGRSFSDHLLGDRIRAELWRTATGAIAPEECAAGELREGLEDAESPAVLRAIWRSLTGFTALDLVCGTGDWLLAAAHVLEPIYLGCLDRMRSWVVDDLGSRDRRRPEYLRDFKTIIRRLDDPAGAERPVALVRRWIVRENLYGADPTACAVRRCRERLLAYGGSADDRMRFLDANIRCFDAGPLWEGATAARLQDGCGPRGLTAASRNRTIAAGSIAEEAVLLARALELLRERRSYQNGADDDLHRAGVQLERRRRALSSRMKGKTWLADAASTERIRLEFLRMRCQPPFRIVRWDR
ncbi:MAG: hypothetical protein WD737_14015 [Gemmatimonadota bacterium]